MKEIADAAKLAEIDWVEVRQGGAHEIWRCGSTMVAIPRHSEVNALTAQGIKKHLQAELGERWWQ